MTDPITKETRKLSYTKRPLTRKQQILHVLEGNELTARQIADRMGYSDMNAVRPRVTELMMDGKIRTVRKTMDLTTNRWTAVFAIEEGGEQDEAGMDQTY